MIVEPEALEALASRIARDCNKTTDDARRWAGLIGDAYFLDPKDRSKVLVVDDSGRIIGRVPLKTVEGG